MAGFSPRYYLFIKMRKFYCCDKGFRETDRPEGVCWVDVVTPHTGDVEYLTKVEQVPEMFLEYLQDKDERARVERDGDWMMTIVRIPIRAHGAMPYVTVPLGVISHGLNRVITVCYHQNHLIDDFAEHTRRKCVLFDNVANFTLRILYSASYWYLDFLRSLTEDVIGTEKALEKSVQNDDLMMLIKIQKSLVFFNTSIKGNSMVLERVKKIYTDTLDDDLYEDVEIELRQADSTVGIYSDILEGTMDSYASIISNNVNLVVKRMTGLSIILMVPTFVASLYGMNVDILITGRYAFWIVIGIAVVLTAAAFLLLRRLRWV